MGATAIDRYGHGATDHSLSLGAGSIGAGGWHDDATAASTVDGSMSGLLETPVRASASTPARQFLAAVDSSPCGHK
jgi:hypothetical protein